MPRRPAGVVGLRGGAVVQGPPNFAPALTFDSAKVYALVEKKAQAVVNRAGQMATGVARERAPVRKVFSGGRRGKPPRFYSLAEARLELPAFLRTEPRHPSGRRMSEAQALKQLMATPIATSRNKANLWSQTGRRPLPKPASGIGPWIPADREAAYEKGRGWYLLNRSAEYGLTAQGRYELKTGRAISGTPIQKRFFRTAQEVEAFKRTAETEHLGGSLRKSIHREDRNEGTTRKVSIVAGGDDAPYARFVEFGTRHAAAQPFLRPALKHVEGPFKTMMRDAFRGVTK